jgi:hemerythrin
MLWNEEYNTGIEPLDFEHRQIFQEIERFEDTMGIMTKDCSKELRELFTFIEDHISRHFPEEERLMQENHYPDFERHRCQHTEFKQFFLEFKNRLEIEGVSSSFTLFTKDTIVCWMKTHIINTDRLFGEYLKAKRTAKVTSEYSR